MARLEIRVKLIFVPLVRFEKFKASTEPDRIQMCC
jgi:hypothetical protein